MENRKLVVLHFDTGRTWRGGQNQVYLLISGLKKYGLRQTLVTPKDSPLEEKIKPLNIKIENLNPINDLDIVNCLKFRKIVKKEKPDIIHFHTSKALGVGCWSIRGFKVKTIVTRRLDLKMRKNLLTMFKYKFVDVIVAISGYIESYFRDLGFSNVEKIYSAVAPSQYVVKKRQNPNSKLQIGMMGAFDLRHKDFLTFIKAADIILQKNRDIRFLIAGSGKDEKKIKELIKKLNREKEIKLVGFVDDIKEFLSTLDVMLHTVNFEGLGTSILQAMVSGLPVVATNVGGIPDLVEDGKNGYLVGVGGAHQAAEKVLKLVGDFNLRNEFGLEGRKIAEEKFSSRQMVQNYYKLYSSL